MCRLRRARLDLDTPVFLVVCADAEPVLRKYLWSDCCLHMCFIYFLNAVLRYLIKVCFGSVGRYKPSLQVNRCSVQGSSSQCICSQEAERDELLVLS